ncbi:PREDICTED: monoacylglycerol lipase ABHD12 [Cyprinodon variegatus]|uniref:monoacylglycerol lipase ABHD12 n=1 Tax=Cyprinodon variegatus TaxID=28743 RepID=UPI000742C720|nr:PREDICTED: monoacylglycerol lipase ABHD12 [Cyprinodon variegatus]
MRRRSSLSAEKDSDPELKQRPGRAAPGGGQGLEEDPRMRKRAFRRSGLLGKMKRMMMLLLLVYVAIPFIIKLFPSIQAKLVFLNFVKMPYFIDLKRPLDQGLNHTHNFYLEPEAGQKIGVWHTVPAQMWREAQGKDGRWYDSTLNSARPVILYLHGNAGTRGGDHRVQLYKVSGVHWLEAVLIHIPEKNRIRTRTQRFLKLMLVPTHTGNLMPCRLIEGHFIDSDQSDYMHAATVYRFLPGFDWFFLDAISANNIRFASDENVDHISCPVLILHAEDDSVVPFHLGKKLYHLASRSQSLSGHKVQFVAFPSSLAYKHKFIYRSPELPNILSDFLGAAHPVAP